MEIHVGKICEHYSIKCNGLLQKNNIIFVIEIINGYYGRLRLLTRGQLNDPSLNSLFPQTTIICEIMEAICQ